MSFNSKNGRKRSFSHESKVSILFITIRRLCLWFAIMIRKEIIMWIHVCPNLQMNINSKSGRKTSFSYETKASISIIPMEWMRSWSPIMNKMKIITWIRVCPNLKMNINSKNHRKRSFFLWIQSINIIYHNEENLFVVPNHENKGDYNVNLCLSKSIDEHYF